MALERRRRAVALALAHRGAGLCLDGVNSLIAHFPIQIGLLPSDELVALESIMYP